MIHHRHCRGSCRVPGTDRNHSDRPSAAIQRDKADTGCHHCTRLRHSRCTHDGPHSAACLQHMRHTDVLCSRYASCRSRCSLCSRWRPIHWTAHSLARNPRTVDRPTNTGPRKHRNPCAACWAPDQPRIGCMVSRQRCTKTSPSETGTTRMLSSRRSTGCPHHTARTHHLSQTRTHCRQQSMPGIRSGL